MKKMISIILTLVLLCSISLVGTNAAKLNVAPTKTPQWFFSTEPYADITTINGYVYGYIGDSDDDGEISELLVAFTGPVKEKGKDPLLASFNESLRQPVD